MKDGVSIIIPTYNGGEVFKKNLAMINSQNFAGEIDLVVIDSGSTDDTTSVARNAGATVLTIENKEFHHSRTRNRALASAKFDKIVYLVQDALPVSEKWLSQLCASLDLDDVASVSIRQIPHEDADVSARFEVEFHGNYLGDKPNLKYIESPDEFSNLSYDEALHLIRHDNVCSIYRRNLLEQYPFPDVDFAEDMAWAHEMILRGYKILYDPRILIMHSHNRPPEYRFKRSIVDSIACSKILGRVKDDISYLTVASLTDITDSVEEFVQKLKDELIVQAGFGFKRVDIVKYYFLVRKYVPMLKKIRKKFGKMFFESVSNDQSFQLERDYSNHIRFVMKMITGSYALSSVDDIYYCVDQVTASTLGRLYGELYSGHMIKGGVPSDVEGLVRPYLKGV